jgi:3-hydroxyacyl-[acyl-carrier-protein] dehydratase
MMMMMTTPSPVTEAKTIVSTTTEKQLPALSCVELQAHIPHRYPFLLVDKVTEHVEGVYIKGIKNVTINEPFFQGHFPAKPIMPGVLQIEALAQLGGILAAHVELGRGNLGVFSGLDGVRFRRMVEPGDQLELHVSLGQVRRNLAKMKGNITVNGQAVVEAEMLFSFVPF